MNLENYYYYFQKVIPDRVCDEIINYGKSILKQKGVRGKVGRENKKLKDLKQVRDSNIAWLTDPWIYREIHPYVNEANKAAGWNFQWDYSEQAQFTTYKKGQHYGWHCDSWIKPYETDNNLNGKIRKLSVTLNLTDPKKYKGGDFEFDFRNTTEGSNTQICKEVKERGSIIVFPSFVWHRVKPVTEGTRYSLVMWNVGDPFK
jgi:PKHD-type hydroxylase